MKEKKELRPLTISTETRLLIDAKDKLNDLYEAVSKAMEISCGENMFEEMFKKEFLPIYDQADELIFSYLSDSIRFKIGEFNNEI